MSCVTCHLSCVMYHVSRVTCDVSHFFSSFFSPDIVVELIGGGCVINGATPSSLDRLSTYISCILKLFLTLVYLYHTNDSFWILHCNQFLYSYIHVYHLAHHNPHLLLVLLLEFLLLHHGHHFFLYSLHRALAHGGK